MKNKYIGLILFIILFIMMFISLPKRNISKELNNQKAVRDLIDNSYSKVKFSNSIILNNIISVYGEKYDEINMYRTNKGVDITVSGIREDAVDLRIYNDPKVKLENLGHFFYNKKTSTISYNMRENPYHRYIFVYYIDKNKIPNECIDCNLLLQDSSLRSVKDFCCILEDNWVILSTQP